MKSTALVCAIAAAALGFGSLASAQNDQRDGRHGGAGGHGGGVEQRGPGQWQGEQQSQRRHGAQDQQRYQQRPVAPVPQQPYAQRREPTQRWGASQPQPQWQYGHDGRYARDGWIQAPRFRRGDYLPYEYRQRHFYVHDWHAHRLYAPPYGYQWVQTDTGDYLLIALATGLIANLLLGQ